MSLDDNSKTDFKARELKSVHVKATGLYLKLLIHKPHGNHLNIYQQVNISLLFELFIMFDRLESLLLIYKENQLLCGRP